MISGFIFYARYSNIIEHSIKNTLTVAANLLKITLTHSKYLDNDIFYSYENEEFKKLWNDNKIIQKETSITYIYIMEKRDDNKFYFIFDSGEVNNDLNSALEDTYFKEYEECPQEVYEAYDSRNIVYTKGTITDRWGTYKSVFVPVIDNKGRIFVVGVDIRIDYITKEKNISLLFILVIFLIAILLSFFFVYWQRNISQTSATFLFILLSLTMIILSTSRTAITVTFINLFLLIYFNNKRKKILILFLLLITAAYFIITIFYPSTVNTIIDKFQFKDGSTSLRTTLYKTALKLFPSNIFGLGPGSAELFYQNSINININAHSTWLEIFINFGIVGFILFNLFHFSVIYKLYGILKFYKKNHPASTNDKIYHSQVMASIVILFTLPLLTFAGSSIIRSLSILWLLYGYILILIKHNYKYNNSMFIH